MIKAIIFDFFDVIRSDQYQAWLKKNGLVRSGIYHEVTQRLDAGKISLNDFFETVSKASGKPFTLELMEADAKVYYEVIELIKNLQKNYKIGLLSNAPSSLFRDLLQKHDLEKLFDEIIVSSEVGLIKPGREIFELALKKLEVETSETIFIDDNIHNVEGAKKIGIIGIQFISAEQLKKDLQAAGVILK